MAHDSGFYLGAGAGYSDADDLCSSVNSIPGGKCDQNGNTWSAFGGYQISPNFAVEAGWSDLGVYDGSVKGFPVHGSYEATSYDASLLGILPLGDMLNVYARGGYSLVNTDTNLRAFGTKFKSDGGSEGAWTYGAGAGVNVTDNIEVRADWTRYNDIGNNSVNGGLGVVVGHVDLDVYSLQALYHFGPHSAPAAAPAEEVSLNIQVLFDTDKSVVKPEYQGEIQKAADYLTAHPEAKAVIEGHTDNTASDAYNQALSERRANSVMNAIAAKGVDASRLSAVGYGESKPVASNATKEGRQENRRVVAEFSGVSIKAM
jgi:OOP family OmpA-OmpF porin